eukprot:evm.model.scf_1138.4 EVM.evm.TU.scf_1138.4   scf_1138:22303-31585(+)
MQAIVTVYAAVPTCEYGHVCIRATEGVILRGGFMTEGEVPALEFTLAIEESELQIPEAWSLLDEVPETQKIDAFSQPASLTGMAACNPIQCPIAPTEVQDYSPAEIVSIPDTEMVSPLHCSDDRIDCHDNGIVNACQKANKSEEPYACEKLEKFACCQQPSDVEPHFESSIKGNGGVQSLCESDEASLDGTQSELLAELQQMYDGIRRGDAEMAAHNIILTEVVKIVARQLGVKLGSPQGHKLSCAWERQIWQAHKEGGVARWTLEGGDVEESLHTASDCEIMDEIRTSSDKLLSIVPPSTSQSSHRTPKTLPSLSLELALSMIPDSEGDDMLAAPCQGERLVCGKPFCPVHNVVYDELTDTLQDRASGADCDRAVGCACAAQEHEACRSGTWVAHNGTGHASLVETPPDVVNQGRIESAANNDDERQNEQTGCVETEPEGKGAELGCVLESVPCVVADSDIPSQDGEKRGQPITVIVVPSSSDQDRTHMFQPSGVQGFPSDNMPMLPLECPLGNSSAPGSDGIIDLIEPNGPSHAACPSSENYGPCPLDVDLPADQRNGAQQANGDVKQFPTAATALEAAGSIQVTRETHAVDFEGQEGGMRGSAKKAISNEHSLPGAKALGLAVEPCNGHVADEDGLGTATGPQNAGEGAAAKHNSQLRAQKSQSVLSRMCRPVGKKQPTVRGAGGLSVGMCPPGECTTLQKLSLRQKECQLEEATMNVAQDRRAACIVGPAAHGIEIVTVPSSSESVSSLEPEQDEQAMHGTYTGNFEFPSSETEAVPQCTKRGPLHERTGEKHMKANKKSAQKASRSRVKASAKQLHSGQQATTPPAVNTHCDGEAKDAAPSENAQAAPIAQAEETTQPHMSGQAVSPGTCTPTASNAALQIGTPQKETSGQKRLPARKRKVPARFQSPAAMDTTKRARKNPVQSSLQKKDSKSNCGSGLATRSATVGRGVLHGSKKCLSPVQFASNVQAEGGCPSGNLPLLRPQFSPLETLQDLEGAGSGNLKVTSPVLWTSPGNKDGKQGAAGDVAQFPCILAGEGEGRWRSRANRSHVRAGRFFSGVSLMVTGYLPAEKRKLEEAIRAHGGRVLHRLPAGGAAIGINFPYLLIAHGRTAKCLSAVARGYGVLTSKWVDDCVEQKALVEPSPQCNHVLHEARPSLHENGVLSGVRVHISGERSFQKVFKDIVIAAGATISDDLEARCPIGAKRMHMGNAPTEPCADVVIASAPEKPTQESGKQLRELERTCRRLKVPLVDQNWAIQAIVDGVRPPQRRRPGGNSSTRASSKRKRHSEQQDSVDGVAMGIASETVSDTNAAALPGPLHQLQWLGPQVHVPRHVSKGAAPHRRYYDGFVCKGEEVHVDDCVELQPSPGEDHGRIVRIEALWSERRLGGRDRMLARCRRFYTPEEIVLPMKARTRPPEIYISDHIEERVALEAFARVVKVNMINRQSRRTSKRHRAADFICEYHYDHVNVAVSARTAA